MDEKTIFYDFYDDGKRIHQKFSIGDALNQAELEKLELEEKLDETIETINNLTPNCDKIDYSLAVSSGVLCGLLDIFCVGKPGESPFGDITDKWYKDKVNKFCKLNNCSNLKKLEEKYAIPYDQTNGGPFQKTLKLSASNHHFKSLAHNPTLLGLFFSILDQFSAPHLSHFVSNGKLITLVNSDSGFELRGHNPVSKLFCAFTNWIGHLISDVSGSYKSRGRGMGLPSPLWTWSNDVIAIKRSLNIRASSFNEKMNKLAMDMYLKGYDARFQTAQAIPVFINEMITRLFYVIRRLINYLSKNKGRFSFKALWKECEPFKNATVKRMLTVSHGAFCVVDTVDAIARGIVTGGQEIFMRLNIIGLGRICISLIGEANRVFKKSKTKKDEKYLKQRKAFVEGYINNLKQLSAMYDDKYLLTFVDDLQNNNNYEIALEKSGQLSELRGGASLKTIEDIDNYFKIG